MAKIKQLTDKHGEIVYPVSKETAIYDENGVLLSNKISTFITRLVDNLANYYLKSEIYTKEEIDTLIGAIQEFSYIVVSELPIASAFTMGTIYLVPSEDPQTQNTKDEYITIRSGSIGSYTYSWEQIGSTAIDLSGYVTTEALNTELAKYTTTANLTTLLAGKQDTIADLASIRSGASLGATAYQKPNSGIPASDIAAGVIPDISGKQDVIPDLSTIRSGAAAGATAYQKPSGGIPATDMASGVQTSLGKADSAYQKPAGGILKADLEGGVQESLELADTAVQADPIGSIVPPVDPSEFATKEEVSQLEAEVDDLMPMSVLYKESVILAKDGDMNGAIDATTGDIETNSTNYYNHYWKLKAGVTYSIYVNITRNLTSRACIAFFSGDSLPVRGDDGTVLKITEISVYNSTYTPATNGYLFIFYQLNSVSYADSISVRASAYIDFKQELAGIEEEIDEINERDITYRYAGEWYRDGYVNGQNGMITSSSGGAKLYLIRKDNIPERARTIFAKVCTQNVIFNAISFYSTDMPADSSYMGSYAVPGKTESSPSLFQANFPTGWKSCLVLNMSQLSADYEIYLDVLNATQIEDIEGVLASATARAEEAKKSLNIFKDKPFYHHLNQEQEMIKQTIPAQSLLDITFAKRLGSNLIEASIHECSDGVYVVKHGNAGKLGAGIKAADSQDYSNTLFSAVSSTWLRSNITYDCNRSKYDVYIPTWDEFLAKCKQEAMSVKFAYINAETLATARKYLTDEEIFITASTRPAGFRGTIEYVFNPNSKTVEQGISECDAIGAPLQITILAGAISSMPDADFIELVTAAHIAGYTVGIVYTNLADTIKYLGLGADGICSSFKQINLFDEGNALNISDLSDNNIVLSGGATYDSTTDTVTIPTGGKLTINSANPYVIGKFCVNIRFSGQVSIWHGGINNPYANLSNYSSDGGEMISYAEAINPFSINDLTNWIEITATGNTTIYELKFVASVM